MFKFSKGVSFVQFWRLFIAFYPSTSIWEWFYVYNVADEWEIHLGPIEVTWDKLPNHERWIDSEGNITYRKIGG